ncbi:Adaptive-response sensory-kinase SasA [Paenibacillus solanacearum]|uniref:histidine kinase n=1 Tax=Paenibacillus solanacearum TaxID=2048548 RepID=A0A916NIF7_9BACL|nr:HAMP domain-containing sensor histidine kinase [Paenibacillus solanacearum]CAG7621396.1 Adaptive-response sensory-kinase SasA [Paenibacillus solanacearum]
MNLRTRLVLLTSSWILMILLFFNLFIYNYIFKKTTEAENRMLWNKAQIILRNPQVHQPENWGNPRLLREFIGDDTMIRIISPENKVMAEISTNKRLTEYPPVYRSDYYSDVDNSIEARMLFIQVPIIENGTQIGQLELGKALNVIGSLMEILGQGLMVTSLSVIVFSVLGSVFYTRVIIRPLRQMLETMQMIRSKGDFLMLGPKYTSRGDEIGRLGHTFNEMITHLQEHDRKQRQFVADASHELRTPLTVIESYTSMLQRWGGNDPAIRREALDAIHSETRRLKSLIESLLKLAEFEREEQAMMEEMALVPLVRETTEQMEQAFNRDIRLTVSGVSERQRLLADAKKIKQLLIIILDNAIKYSVKPIDVTLADVSGFAELKIADQGVGVAEEDLPHVFERFYRVDQTRNRETGGTGLGLAIARQIVDLHHGTIRFDSKAGQGSTVTILLPWKTQSEH